MRSINILNLETDEQRREYRAIRDTLQNAVAALEEQYSEDRAENRTPPHTVKSYIEKYGRETAETVIATLVNRSAWDGRISERNAKWAAACETAWDSDSAYRMSIYTNKIHMAHLDQLADAMRKTA